jgi:polysaccharide chain length determinant protein (PEP-CTERM system associated)
MRRNLDSLLQRYTEDHPDVAGARRVLKELEEQRRQLSFQRRKDPSAGTAPLPSGLRASDQLRVSLAQTEASVASLSTRVAEYSSRYERLKSSAALVPQLEAEHAQLNRDYDINKKNYESLVARRESANISSEMQQVAGVSDFRLVDPPRVSPRPVSPNRRILIPLALFVALAAGLGAAYLFSESRPTVYDGRVLREVSGLPLLGVVTAGESESRRAQERRSVLRYAGLSGALVLLYGVTFVALELLTVKVV